MNRSPLLRVLHIGVATLFAWAGVAKGLDPAAFAIAIDNYRLLPWIGSVGLALYLPWLEIVAAVAIFPSCTRLGALSILVGLCAVFVAALGAAQYRGLDITCGCFGASADVGTGWAILRAVALLGLCVALLIVEGHLAHGSLKNDMPPIN